MRADLRLAGAEHPGARPSKLVARGEDIGDLVADVMNAAVGVLLEEPGDRRLRRRAARSSSILVLGSMTNTTVTPCSGSASGADTSAPSVSR